MLSIARVDLLDPDVQDLIAQLDRELAARYPEPGANHFRLDPDEVAPGRGALLLARSGEEVVGCGALRVIEPGTAELKRMFAVPSARRRGIGRAILVALEQEARRLGVTRLVLETGIRQPEAIALYRAHGFEKIPPFGEYMLSTKTSACMAKNLQLRRPCAHPPERDLRRGQRDGRGESLYRAPRPPYVAEMAHGRLAAALWWCSWGVGLTAGGGAALAQAQNGDILVPEFLSGSVVNIRGGGDFTGAARFATGLTAPMGLCQGPGGRIYATESGADQVTDITDGGDFTGMPAFATGIRQPASLLCSPTQILVTELDSGQITDITDGGDFGQVPEFARIDINPADILRDGQNRLWLTSFNDGVIEITGGGDFRGDPYFAPNNLVDQSSITITRMGDQLLVGNEHTDHVIDFTAGGNLAGRPVFARVRGVIGLRFIPQTGQLLAASELDDAIYDITEGGDFRTGAPPFATGLVPEDVCHMVYVDRRCGNGTPDEGEECDDGNQSDTDACPRTCRNAFCGDGFVRAGVEECDDGNTQPGDGCDAACQSEEDPGDDGTDDGTDGPDGGVDDGPDGGVDDGTDDATDGTDDATDGTDATDGSDDATGDGVDDGSDGDDQADGESDGDGDGGGGGCASAGPSGSAAGAVAAIGLALLVSISRSRRRRTRPRA